MLSSATRSRWMVIALTSKRSASSRTVTLSRSTSSALIVSRRSRLDAGSLSLAIAASGRRREGIGLLAGPPGVDGPLDEGDDLLAAVEHGVDVLVAGHRRRLELQHVALPAEVGEQADVQAEVQRLPAGLGRGRARLPVEHEVHPDERAWPAHVADRRMD